MLEQLCSVQLTAKILRRPPERAINRDLIVVRDRVQRLRDKSRWLKQESVRWFVLNGYQVQQRAKLLKSGVALKTFKADMRALGRLAKAVDHAIELTKPRRGPGRIDPMIHHVVRELIWTYEHCTGLKFRGVRADKRRGPAAEFVRAAMALLVPTTKRTEIDRAMRLAKQDSLVAVYGAPRAPLGKRPGLDSQSRPAS